MAAGDGTDVAQWMHSNALALIHFRTLPFKRHAVVHAQVFVCDCHQLFAVEVKPHETHCFVLFERLHRTDVGSLTSEFLEIVKVKIIVTRPTYQPLILAVD